MATDTPHVDVRNLTFAYPGRPAVLRDLNMQLTDGARCLLIGANGAGKSTLLRILAGRHLTKPDEAVRVLGRSAFHDTRLNFERAYLDTGKLTFAYFLTFRGFDSIWNRLGHENGSIRWLRLSSTSGYSSSWHDD